MEIEEEIAQGFDSESDENNEEISSPVIIDKIKFSQDKIIATLQSYNLIKSQILCPICNKGMTMVNTKDTIDNKYWRCMGKEPAHDQKINIRINSIFEGFKVQLNTLYYLLFHCFVKNYSIKKAYCETSYFCKVMNQPKPCLKTIVKIFRAFRTKIKEYYHK